VLNSSPCCHPFDEEGEKGYIRAEGYGTLILKRLSDAEADGDRILCLLANGVAGAAGPQVGIGMIIWSPDITSVALPERKLGCVL